jgi:hypothetical protein
MGDHLGFFKATMLNVASTPALTVFVSAMTRIFGVTVELGAAVGGDVEPGTTDTVSNTVSAAELPNPISENCKVEVVLLAVNVK